MMHRARSSIVEVPYCFSRSSIKFQGHTALKIVEFDPKWAFPDCNSGLNSPMAMKCCTKLETAKERCPIVFQGHPSNFKITRYKASPILTQIGRFRTIGSKGEIFCKGEMPYRFPRSSVKFQDHTVQSITDFDPNWAFPDYRPVAAFKSLRFALFLILVLFWLSETGQIWGFQAFSGTPMEEMAWNFACWCILATFRTD